MNIYTLNVGQGQFVIVTGASEAFVVDAYVPLSTEQETVFVTAALAKALTGKNLVGVIATGFDSDHFCEVGLRMVINKYNAEWLMYPSYKKESDTADACFKFLNERHRGGNLKKISVLLDGANSRLPPANLSKDFTFEAFSPSKAERDSSNNSSLVIKVTEKGTNATYLITGDTENSRWNSIVAAGFGNATKLKAQVLAAAHHGSRNGLTDGALTFIKPHTVLISAGVGNKHGHPHPESLALFKKHGAAVHRTNDGTGQSLLTVANGGSPVTTPWNPLAK